MSLSKDDEYIQRKSVSVLGEISAQLTKESVKEPKAAFVSIKKMFDERVKVLSKDAEKAGEKLSNAFKFCDEVFSDGQEMLILVTELTISYYGAHFISRYGCKEYFEHNKELLFYERQKEIIFELEKLEIEE